MNALKVIRDSYNNRYDPNTARKITDFLWYGSIRLSFVLLVVAFGVAVWLLYDAVQIAGTSKTNGGTTETVNRAQLNDVLGVFTNRSLRYDSFKRGGTSIVDPGR